jgi:hypothetical protein
VISVSASIWRQKTINPRQVMGNALSWESVKTFPTRLKKVAALE